MVKHQLQSSQAPAIARFTAAAVPVVAEGTPMDTASVIRRARLALGLSKIGLAKEMGVSRQSVSNWEKKVKPSLPSREIAPRLAARLKIPLAWISATPPQSNVESVPSEAHSGRQVPVLSWVEAGRGAEVVASYALDMAHEFVFADAAISDKSFGLRVKGDSMEPEFHDGDLVIIDPTVTPERGDYVVAELLPKGVEPGQGETVLKEYRPRYRGGSEPAFDLVPANPDYPAITVNGANPGRIIGTVVEWRQFRRRRKS